MIRGKIRRLHPVHQATLRAILEHLMKVAANSKHNKMDAKNLAVVFGPVILGEETVSTPIDILTMSKVDGLIITIYALIPTFLGYLDGRFD
jgi:hypothetical protein